MWVFLYKLNSIFCILFKSFYKSYGNFGKELIDIHFESPCRFGYSTYANIPIHADLINNAYLNLNLNLQVNDFDLNIKTDSTTTPIFSSNTNSVFWVFSRKIPT